MLDNVDKILTINNSQGFSRILLILWNQQKKQPFWEEHLGLHLECNMHPLRDFHAFLRFSISRLSKPPIFLFVLRLYFSKLD